LMATDEAERQRRLMALLEPFHDQARATARRLCRSHADGDDLFHEALLRAFDCVDELREVERFRSWFFAVMISVHRKRHRRSFWRRFLSLDEVDAEPAIDGKADQLDGARTMARALATLAPAEREALVLFELQGFTLEELMAAQGSSLSAVKSRLARARARLRRLYERAERPVVAVKERTHEHG
jgi:RNA polymerase sigma-70 factor, ECF subfamily